MRIHRHSSRPAASGYAMVMVLVFAAIGLTVLSATMNWTSSTSAFNERSNQLSTTMFAAEAATEKIITQLMRDYTVSGEGNLLNIFFIIYVL